MSERDIVERLPEVEAALEVVWKRIDGDAKWTVGKDFWFNSWRPHMTAALAALRQRGEASKELAIALAEEVRHHAKRAEAAERCITELGALVRRGGELCEEAATRIAELEAALWPFAEEGNKWLWTPAVHDGLKLLCGEGYGLMARPSREASFTIGDLKRATTALTKKDNS